MNKILILDDNERFADSLCRNIHNIEGYEIEDIETVTTPAAAIDLARQAIKQKQPYSVLLIDQNLNANIDGIQTMQEILITHPDADTIIFTGYDTPEDGLRAYEAGASRYLPKPFESRELELVLKELARSQKVRINEARQQRQFKVATEIAEAVGVSLNLENTMTAILETLVGVFDKTRLCVLLYDEDANAIHFAPTTLRYYQIDNPQFTGQDKFPLNGKTIACRVAKKTLQTKQMEIENIRDVEKDDSYLKLNQDTKSEFCISLLNTKHELLGVLAMERSWHDGFEESDLALIKMAARHISVAIERAKQGEELEVKSFVSAQTSWAVNIAHEINNEVGKIATWAYLIQSKSGEDPIIHAYARDIEESAYRLSAANPWASKPPQSVEIDPLIQKSVGKVIAEKGEDIHVDFKLNAKDIWVTIKPVQFHFVLKQMINNAIQAMRGVDLKAIVISTQISNEQSLEIRFQNFGPTISDYARALLFRKPYTTKEKGGFGLLLSRQMLEEMQGKIMLEQDQVGMGTTFLIRLPIAPSVQEGI